MLCGVEFFSQRSMFVLPRLILRSVQKILLFTFMPFRSPVCIAGIFRSCKLEKYLTLDFIIVCCALNFIAKKKKKRLSRFSESLGIKSCINWEMPFSIFWNSIVKVSILGSQLAAPWLWGHTPGRVQVKICGASDFTWVSPVQGKCLPAISSFWSPK